MISTHARTVGALSSFTSPSQPPLGGEGTKGRKESERFRAFSLAEIQARGYNLDITWLKDELHEDGDGLAEPAELAAEAIGELEAAVDELQELLRLLESDPSPALPDLSLTLPLEGRGHEEAEAG